ncbi:hypothetical protein NST07_23460 [Paenibacillus sp. FSL L8-0340]|uniref:DUF6979 family protein n=1 Tax=Paenibacillus sp. FSL L8-0340 TaxID=2954685 RepID=UPI0031580AF8
MGLYGVVAVRTVRLIKSEEQLEPLKAWNIVASEVFGEGTWAQQKSCPKSAFLGLCEAGMIQGIVKGKYAGKTGLQKNKKYAIKAVQILKNKPELAENKLKLWSEVRQGAHFTHDSQMDVVVALWSNNLIVLE